MIELENVSKHFQVGAETVRAVDGVSLTVEAGQIVAIVGPSGCGKTTLLNMIGQLVRPTSGKVRIEHEDVAHLGERDAARLRNTTFGYVVQDFALVESDTVFDNVRIPLVYSPTRRRGQRSLVTAALDSFGVDHLIDYPVAKLSGGQRQRVALARAIVNNPKIILADEPTGALDAENTDHVFDYIQRSARAGRSVVMVTHDAELASRCDQIHHIRDGRLVAPGAHRGVHSPQPNLRKVT